MDGGVGRVQTGRAAGVRNHGTNNRGIRKSGKTEFTDDFPCGIEGAQDGRKGKKIAGIGER